MQCKKCGKTISDEALFCDGCGSPVNGEEVKAADTIKENAQKAGFFRSPTKGAKSYAAVFTALMVLPATLCIAFDLAFHRSDGWSAYVVGALFVAWMVAVFPALRITPVPVTAFLCFASVVGYGAFIVGKTGRFIWMYEIALPLFLLLAIFIAADSALIGNGKIKGLHILSVISLEISLYLIATEIVYDLHIRNEIDIRWSAIISCFFISAVALFEAIQYVFKINKK